jgi:hypothetical protein
MNQLRRVTIIISVLLTISVVAAGQKQPRTKSRPSPPVRSRTASNSTRRPVIVNLIQGGQVTGTFLRADTETVQVEVESGRVTVKLNEVASLIFTTDGNDARAADESSSTPPPASDPTLPIARKAYTALSKLADAAQVKLPAAQYQSLLIEVKPVVGEAVAELPDGALKTDIIRALETYKDASRAYSAAQHRGSISIFTEPGASLMKKYDIKPGVNRLAQEDHIDLDVTLSAIWARAAIYLNNIVLSLGQ